MAAIALKNVSIQIPIYDIGASSLRKMILSKTVGGRFERSGSHVIVDALKDISFEAHDGDRIALVGNNGSGKSTLLRLLSDVYPATTGTVQVVGEVSPMFDAMLGMSMDATGMENIWICGRLWGLSPAQIKNSIDDIIDFTELGDYLNVPVRTYSTGMLLRLAFAIATVRDPEILLLDEVVGVGDATFFEKAFNRLQGIIHRSQILFLASHADDILRKICNKAIWLDHGNLIQYGEFEEVIAAYRAECIGKKCRCANDRLILTGPLLRPRPARDGKPVAASTFFASATHARISDLPGRICSAACVVQARGRLSYAIRHAEARLSLSTMAFASCSSSICSGSCMSSATLALRWSPGSSGLRTTRTSRVGLFRRRGRLAHRSARTRLSQLIYGPRRNCDDAACCRTVISRARATQYRSAGGAFRLGETWTWHERLLVASIGVVGLLLLLIKGLYPGGGHDYYTHYFYYYQTVIDLGGLWPNDVWYHYYYSKGSGLFFLGMLLTDPLAPQLVTFCFMAVAAAALYLTVEDVAPKTNWPSASVLVFISIYIFTPGWGEFEKDHEFNTALILGVIWMALRLFAPEQIAAKFVFACALSITAAVIINTQSGLYFGAVFALLAMVLTTLQGPPQCDHLRRACRLGRHRDRGHAGFELCHDRIANRSGNYLALAIGRRGKAIRVG